MEYTLSHCVCIETPESESAATFYQENFGLEFSSRDGNSIELKSGDRLLYFDKSPTQQTILEFTVNDLDAAREDLISKGCSVVRWEGKGKPCYMRDPFGLMFNLYQP